jgi:hypothetical protein
MPAMDAAPEVVPTSWFRGLAGRRYGRQLFWVVVIKLVALTLLYFVFIAPQPRTDLSPGAMQQHLFDADSAHSSSRNP